MLKELHAFLLKHLSDTNIKKIATVGPAGYSCKCPGTIGSIIGILWYLLAFSHVNGILALLLYIFTIMFGVVICTESERIIGRKDPSEVIIDEVLAIPLCYFGIVTNPGNLWIVLLLGFVLFRFFDIKKPFSIDKVQALPGGLGVMADDALAALYSNVALNVICAIFF